MIVRGFIPRRSANCLCVRCCRFRSERTFHANRSSGLFTTHHLYIEVSYGSLFIACAIFSDRRILILDEPTSGLDGQNMRLIAEKLKSEARRGRTILVITHDRELIESCCDNVVEVGTKPSEVQ